MGFNVIAHEQIFSPDDIYPSCHASTNVVLSSGVILAAWFGGSYEKADDVDIWYSRKVNGKWEKQRRAAYHKDIPCWNPVLFDFGDRVTLFYKVGKTIPGWKTYFVESDDEGMTWSEPKELVPGDETGGRGPVKNQPIRLQSGAILAPASKETLDTWDVFTDRSEDNGRTFVRSDFVYLDRENVLGKGLIQPALWQDDEGIVHMFTRSTENCIYHACSRDEGRTWSEALPTNLPNNNSGISLVRTDRGQLALVCNPQKGTLGAEGYSWAKRTPLMLTLSDDNGCTWGDGFCLESEDGEKESPEFSYPTVTAKGADLFITYTWKRKCICFWQIRISG